MEKDKRAEELAKAEKLLEADKKTVKLKRKGKTKKIVLSTTFALAGAALVITPIVYYIKEKSAYEVVIESANNAFQSYAMSLKRGATIANLKSKLVEIEGHLLAGVYKNEECTEQYSDTDKVTKNATVYLKYEKLTYSVSFPSSESFKILYSSSVDTNKIEWGDSFLFQVLLEAPYSQSDIVVKAGDDTLVPDDNGFYQIPFVNDDILVQINGVEINTYKITNLPTQVTAVNSKGEVLSTESEIVYGEEITVSYTETPGYDKTKFLINGQEVVSGESVVVTANLNIAYEEIISNFAMNLPSALGYKIEYDTTIDLSTLNIGDNFKFKVVLNDGYTQSVITVKANGQKLTADSSGNYVVTLGDESVTITIDGVHLNTYTVASLPAGVAIKDKNGQALTSNYVTHGQQLTVTYTETAGYDKSIFKINGQDIANNYTFTVTGDINVQYEEVVTSRLIDLPDIEGVTYIYDQSIDLNSFVIGDTFSFKIALDEGYSESDITVTATTENQTQQLEPNSSGEYSVTFGDDIIAIEITGVELNKYVVASLPAKIVLSHNGNLLAENSVITYGDRLTVSYTETIGYDKSVFTLNGENIENNHEFVVTGDVTIDYQEVESIFTLTLPEVDGVTYEYDATDLISFKTGDIFGFKVILDEAHSESDITVTANGEHINKIGDYYIVSFVDDSILVEIAGVELNIYEITNLPEQIVLLRNGEELTEESIIRHGDVITITYEETEGYAMTNFAVNGEEVDGHEMDVEMTGQNITVDYSEMDVSYFTFSEGSDLVSISAYNGDIADIVIPETYHKKPVIGIDSSVFENCSTIRSVTISANLESIGDDAFKNSSLSEINFKQATNLSTITYGTFHGCTNLTEVDLSNTKLTEIGPGIFCECSSLSEVVLPENVTSIGPSAFQQCNSLSIIQIPNKVEIIGEDAFNSCGFSSITIPKSVTEIQGSAFQECRNLTQVNIEEGSNWTTMGIDLFMDSGLESINLENATKLTNIGNSAFVHVPLTTITLPSSIETIEGYAFQSSKLQSIEIPANVTSIEFEAFASPYLEEIKFAEGSKLESIGTSAFKYSSLDSIVIPKGVTELQSEVFASSLLKKISLEEDSQLATIALDAFAYCEYFEEADFINSIALTELPDGLFAENTTLKKVTIPASLITINDGTFYKCSALQEVIFDENSQLEKIGTSAFGYCEKLTNITIPKNVKELGYGSFEYCTKLETVSIEEGSKLETIDQYAFVGCEALVNITLPASVTAINDAAFALCSSLLEINIPKGVVTIGEYAFTSCSKLETLTFVEESELTTIKQYAFDSCVALVNINLEACTKLTTIETGAFASATALASIKLPGSLNTMEDHVFYYCSKLQTVEICSDSSGVSQLIEIAEGSFEGCSELTEVKNLDYCTKLTVIGKSAFRNCIKLSSILIPVSVIKIDDYAFYQCTALSEINITENSQLETIGVAAFYECPEVSSIALQYATKLTEIKEHAFTGIGLFYLYIPASVTSIGDYAFENSYRLYDIDIQNYDDMSLTGSQLISIGEGAFYNCSVLRSITLNMLLESIGQFAFRGCSLLEDVIIPDYHLRYIGNGAFAETAITTATLSLIDGEGSYLGHGIFSLCENLQTLYLESSFVFNNLSEEDVYVVLNCIGGGRIYVRQIDIFTCDNEYLYKYGTKIDTADGYSYFVQKVTTS